MDEEKKKPVGNHAKRPMMNPYIFTCLLMAFGLWCFYDGWLVKESDMEAYAVLMNKVFSLILIPWSIWDFFKVRKRYGQKGRAPEN